MLSTYTVRDQDRIEWNGIEQNRTEQNRTEQNRTEQNRTEQNRTEQNRTEQNRTEQNRIGFIDDNYISMCQCFNSMFKSLRLNVFSNNSV